MGLLSTKHVCHYCRGIRKVSRRTGLFRPHSVLVGVSKSRVPSIHVEPSLRDNGPTTVVQSGIWRVCYGSERKPWPNFQ